MRPNDPHDGPRRRRRRPELDALEARDLPASLGPALPGRHYPAADVQQFVPDLYPPGTPQPTPAEVDRESFVALAVGRYTVGPGHNGTEALTIHGYGKSQSNNQSEHGHFQYDLFTPSSAAPNQTLSGVINIFPQNYLASGASLILDLQGPTTSEVNVGGVMLPTTAYWVHDVTSGTTYTGAGIGIVSPNPAIGVNGATYQNFAAGPNTNYFDSTGSPVNPLTNPNPNLTSPGPSNVDNWNMGFGAATFKYIPDKHPQPGTLGSGTVALKFTGLINYSGDQSAIDKNYQ